MCIWSIACGALASTQVALDIMRGLQGLGPAAAIPASLGVLAQSFEPGSKKRTLAFATFTGGAPFGTAVGNIVNSVLTQYTKYAFGNPHLILYDLTITTTRPSWKSGFYFQAGLCALTATLAFLAIDADTDHLDPSLDRRVDWIGALLVTSGLVLITFAVGDGELARPSQWRSGYIIALIIVGVLLVAAFVGWEHYLGSDEEGRKDARRGKRAQPLLHLGIFKREHGRLAVMLAVAFFVWAGFCGWNLYAVVRSRFS